MSEVSIAAPDLSHLPYETRVRIAVAVCRGAGWLIHDNDTWSLHKEGRGLLLLIRGEVARDLLPSIYDPAVWGPLMERSLAMWETGEFDGERQHRCWWLADDGLTRTPGPWTRMLSWAVCLAFLAKHGRAVEP